MTKLISCEKKKKEKAGKPWAFFESRLTAALPVKKEQLAAGVVSEPEWEKK